MPPEPSAAQPDQVAFHIPPEISAYAASYCPTTDPSAQMRFVIAASRLNFEHGFGAPFAAAITERRSGDLVALGTNLVATEQLALLHAEMVAIALAQRRLGSFDLGAEGLPAYDLVTSCEPCTMCLGGAHWCGVQRVIAGARDADAAEIGFDEGPKPDDWAQALRQRGIEVMTDIERDAARAVLQRFKTCASPALRAMINRPL